MTAFPARYNGRCGSCDERIREGDLIRFDMNSDSNFVHDDCAEAAPVERPEPPVCTTCWLVHPVGVCDR